MSKRTQEVRIYYDVVECLRKVLYREEYEYRLGIAALCERAIRRIFLAEERERARRQPERTFGYRHGGDLRHSVTSNNEARRVSQSSPP